MKIAIVGYGSIGKKHSEILRDEKNKLAIVSSQSPADTLHFKTLEQCLSDFSPDVVWICNPTGCHLESLDQLKKLGYTGRVLLEKPLAIKSVSASYSCFNDIRVTYNLRFQPLLLALKSRLENEEILSVHAYVGQYLPHWRPQQDYRASYSAQKKMGGGVLRDLSHELDYIAWLGAGAWQSFYSHGGRVSPLEIDSEDIFSFLGSSVHCPHITLTMNYLDRLSQRFVTVNTNKETYHLDFISGVLRDSRQVILENVSSMDSYKKQVQAILSDNWSSLCSFEEANEVLRVIERAEQGSGSECE